MTLVTEDIKIISNKAKGNWVLKEYQREKKWADLKIIIIEPFEK